MVQAVHACARVLLTNKDHDHVVEYSSPLNVDRMLTVALGVKNEAQLLHYKRIFDEAGLVSSVWVELPEEVPSALALLPYTKEAVQPLLKKLQTFRL